MIELKKESGLVRCNIEHKTLEQRGYVIHYYTTGETSNPLLVFLHAAFTDHRCFDHQIDFFAKHFRVLTVDMLGHGLSQMAKATDKIDATVEHLNVILEREGYNKAHIVGVSMGTLLAQYYALVHPQKVLSLTVLGGYDINADNKEIAKAQRSEQLKWIVQALFSMNAFRKHVASFSVSKPEEQQRFFEMAGLFTRKSFMAMQGLGKVLQPRKTGKRNYPFLILCGDEDIELSRRMNQKWHETEPQSHFHIIANAGHCANMDQPDAFNRLVFAFIQANGW